MLDRRRVRWILFSVSLILLSAALIVLFRNDRNNRSTCMGVKILDESEMLHYTESVSCDFWYAMNFYGEQVPFDIETNTIYISQNIQEDTELWELEGFLTLNQRGYEMYFMPDPYFENLAEAVKIGHPFQLILTDGSPAYMCYQLIFTKLPVISLSISPSYKNDRDLYVYKGDFCLWDPADSDTGYYTVKTSPLECHNRGESSLFYSKKSWKLALKTQKGKTKDLSLMGLGEDDDWILKAMVFDDTKLKEKLVMELWQEMTEQSKKTYKMSRGRYVELVVNDKYYGLYMLQRRVDRKYLELNKGDILLKGASVELAESADEAYEIVYSPLSEAETYALMEGIWSGSDCTITDINSFVDMSVFLQFGAMYDNLGYKNMFYILRQEKDGYKLSWVLWDTDVSFGVVWAGGLVYNYNLSLTADVKRTEYDSIRALYPDLDERISARWQELRQTVLSEENVLSVLERAENELTVSGAFNRDQLLYPTRYGENDSWEALFKSVKERLLWLDHYYEHTS